MSAMKRLIIADAHVGQRTGDVADMTSMVLDAGEQGVTEIIYLGDAFQYLIGMSKFWTPGVIEVMSAWRRLRAAGVTIGVIEGNRDFFLDAADLQAELDWSGTSRDFVAGDRHYRLVHGDKVNRRDLQYRFWSRISKSLPARVWAHLLPPSLANAIVRGMEARLAETNRKFRYRKPLPCLRRAAERAWSQGVDVILWGHFHGAWWYRWDDRAAAILPAWLETGLAAVVEPDGELVMVEKNLTPGPALFTIGG
jgi:UDP-2,3-diacylglucosamine pyrophosphatase LpxH